ncbi:hypothetical protein [Salipiger aestuarii]|nr:hypothetical protein [Salipiger aestuarii]
MFDIRSGYLLDGISKPVRHPTISDSAVGLRMHQIAVPHVPKCPIDQLAG